MASWHEKDENWHLSAPLIFREERVEKTQQQVTDLIALLGLEPGMHLVDLCCGNGRHALELARRGFRVTGVDRTARFLDEAAAASREAGLDIEWVCDDVRTFCREGAFDAALCLGASFSYFDSREEDRQFVRQACRSLKPGGPFVLEADGKEITARTFQERQWWNLGDTIALAEFRIRGPWEILETHWIALIGDERIELTTTQRLYSGLEGIALLTEAGFAEADVYGHQDGRPYDHDAEIQVFVGRRARSDQAPGS